MKKCENCGVFIHGVDNVCPLCQGRIEGEDDERNFPVVATVYERYEMFFKWLAAGTISAAIIAVAVNLILPQSGIWSLFVALGTACFWISLAIAFRNRNNISKNIVWQVVIISLMCMMWDYVTGWKGWSLNYAFPISCAVGMVLIEILSRVLDFRSGNCRVYMITDVVLGITPIVLYFCGVITVSIPSVICTAFSAIFLAFTLLFYGEEIKKELTRKFHF